MVRKVIYLDFGGVPHDIEKKVKEVLAWYHLVSNRKFFCEFRKKKVPQPLKPFSLYGNQGGMGQWPYNSQMAASFLAKKLHPLTLRSIRDGSGGMVCVVPPAFHPHTWSLPAHVLQSWKKKGICLYTFLPIRADHLSIAHELGHLLHGWPDLSFEPTLRNYCLMAGAGIRINDALHPREPCGPLKKKAGWVNAIECKSTTLTKTLSSKVCGAYSINGKTFEFHRAKQINGPDEVVLFDVRKEYNAIRPILLKKIPYSNSIANRPILTLAPEFLLRP
jgi:hypothetical protein